MKATPAGAPRVQGVRRSRRLRSVSARASGLESSDAGRVRGGDSLFRAGAREGPGFRAGLRGPRRCSPVARAGNRLRGPARSKSGGGARIAARRESGRSAHLARRSAPQNRRRHRRSRARVQARDRPEPGLRHIASVVRDPSGRRGEDDEALRHAQQAVALDPLSGAIHQTLGLVHYYGRRFERPSANRAGPSRSRRNSCSRARFSPARSSLEGQAEPTPSRYGKPIKHRKPPMCSRRWPWRTI